MSVLSEIIYERSQNQAVKIDKKILGWLKMAMFLTIVFIGYSFRLHILAFMRLLFL
jgi:hypothetical protein